MYTFRTCLLLPLALCLLPLQAYAYVDPGAGMMLWQGLIAGAGMMLTFFRAPRAIIRRLVDRWRGK